MLWVESRASSTPLLVRYRFTCAALPECKVVLRGASLVRVPGDREGHAGVGDQDGDLRIERSAGVVTQIVAVVVEVDLLREHGSGLAGGATVGRRRRFTRRSFC